MVLHLAQSVACSLPAKILSSLILYLVSFLRGYLHVRTLSIIYGSISQAYRPKACTRSAVKELFTFGTPPFFYRLSFVSPVFCPITELIPKLVIGLHKLYIEEKLLHRDISIGSLAYEDVDRTPRIINLELELPTRIEHEARPVEVRTGTAPFMSRDVLKESKSGYRHTLSHDLESVYYISGWHIAGYRGYELPAINNVKPDPFRHWKYGTYEEMLQAKEKHMDLPVGQNPFFNLVDSKYGWIADCLGNVRDCYYERSLRVDNYDQVQKEERLVAVNAIKVMVARMRLPKNEAAKYKREKVADLDSEIKPHRPTTAISFREWAWAAHILPDGVNIGDCKQHDCCGDEIATVVNGMPFETYKTASWHGQKTYTKKTFRTLAIKHYRCLSKVDNSEVFWESVRLNSDASAGLHRMHTEEKHLHRNISIENLACETVKWKALIILLDFELATKVDEAARTNDVRTGTAVFMAREALTEFQSGYRLRLLATGENFATATGETAIA